MLFIKTDSDSRLFEWRTIRQANYNTIQDVLEVFADIKVLPRYLDYYTPKSWPSPFEIVSEGYFCQSGITLVLLATLYHKGFIQYDTICMPVVSNNNTGKNGLVIKLDDDVFNFTAGRIDDWSYVKHNATIFQIHEVAIKDII